MKYNDKNPPLQCFQNQSSWMKGANKNCKPVGILWHDTAAGNPYIKRYVQPDDNAPDRDYWLDLLGVNKYANDWNHSDRDAGLNCWVGKLADETVTTVQAGPWTTQPWGCGGGDRGSCNGYIKQNGRTKYVPEFWIQFEICDDSGEKQVTYYDNGVKKIKKERDYTKGSKEYFDAIYKEACEITAYLCKTFNIDPKGTVKFADIDVPTILCHSDSHKLKLGSDHSDVLKWFKVYGYTMDKVRDDVAKLIEEDKPVVVEMYRVRKAWDDPKSQIGAYRVLAYAIEACDEAGYGYSVFNNAGEVVYSAPEPQPDPIEQDPVEPDPVEPTNPDPVDPVDPVEPNTPVDTPPEIGEEPSAIKRFLIALLNALKKIFGK